MENAPETVSVLLSYDIMMIEKEYWITISINPFFIAQFILWWVARWYCEISQTFPTIMILRVAQLSAFPQNMLLVRQIQFHNRNLIKKQREIKYFATSSQKNPLETEGRKTNYINWWMFFPLLFFESRFFIFSSILESIVCPL